MQWESFLTFAANIYKYNFNSALMIYAQRPDATMVADMKTWNNKVGLYIKRGTRSIAVFNPNNPEPTLEYLFDVKDLDGNLDKVPKLWRLDENTSKNINEQLSEKYNLEYKNIQDTIQQLSKIKMDNLLDTVYKKTNINEKYLKAYLLTIRQSVEYVVAKRCGIDIDSSNYFKYIKAFNNTKLTLKLGYLVNNISRDILKEIEKEILNIKEKESILNEGNNRSTISRGERNFISNTGDGREQNNSREIRQNGNEISKRGDAEQIRFSISDRGTYEGNSSGRPTSHGEI